MKFSRTLSAADQLYIGNEPQNVLDGLMHQVHAAIAREHMDHDVTANWESHDDGSVTLSVEY